MLKEDILKLIKEYGVKREAIIKTIGTNRVSFQKKLDDNSFSINDKYFLYAKYGKLLK